MREIKFRVWDKYRNQLYICDDIYFAQEPLNEAFKLDEFDFMQYTGLKDANGLTEIYEGDIVKLENILFKVVYVNGHDSDYYDLFPRCAFFGLVPLNQNKDEPLIQIMDFQFDDEYRYEVIGNIYENPELLERIK